MVNSASLVKIVSESSTMHDPESVIHNWDNIDEDPVAATDIKMYCVYHQQKMK